ncbi:hypothetical protein MK805_12285 [Shimazuella sp. AN120528]|nr:hypothetical protein [Shimazuella soli]
MNPSHFQCPLCNGYTSYLEKCPNCLQTMEDYGPASFLLASYSPYRPIEEMKQNDGWLTDGRQHYCPHEVFCPACGFDRVVFIREIQT